MLSIQDVGLSVFGDSPKKLYILGGSEYGIKEKYIDILVDKIGAKLEYDSVEDVIGIMSKYHIIPLPPRVYVVRYDKAFVSAANKDLAAKLLSLNIIGTLVLIYEDTKDLTKLDKLFPDNTASIDPIDVKHMTKYLTADFPELDKKSIGNVAKYACNYYQAKNICRCLDAIKGKMLLTEKQLLTLFDIKLAYTNEDVQVAIASRNFNALMYILDHYDGDLNSLLYQILRVMLEIDKCQSTKYTNSPLKAYAKNWTPIDVYYMFSQVYNVIQELRSGADAEIYDMIVYLGALMMFTNVPSIDVLK
jgi:hypothetical protein